MITPTRRLEPSFKMIIIIGVLLAFVCAAVYLSNTSFIRFFNNKATDGILATSSQKAGPDAVVVVDRKIGHPLFFADGHLRLYPF